MRLLRGSAIALFLLCVAEPALGRGAVAFMHASLITSAYGAVTLAKVAGLGVLVLFGAHHRLRVIPRLAEAPVASRFTTLLRREVFALSLVMLLGGLLAYIPTPAP